jgi:hypothetical protein
MTQREGQSQLIAETGLKTQKAASKIFGLCTYGVRRSLRLSGRQATSRMQTPLAHPNEKGESGEWRVESRPQEKVRIGDASISSLLSPFYFSIFDGFAVKNGADPTLLEYLVPGGERQSRVASVRASRNVMVRLGERNEIDT